MATLSMRCLAGPDGTIAPGRAESGHRHRASAAKVRAIQWPDVLCARPPGLRVHDHAKNDARARRRADVTERSAFVGQYEHVVLSVVLLDETKLSIVLEHGPGAIVAAHASCGRRERGTSLRRKVRRMLLRRRQICLWLHVLGSQLSRLRVGDYRIHQARANWWKPAKGLATRWHDEHVGFATILLDKAEVSIVLQHGAGTLHAARSRALVRRRHRLPSAVIDRTGQSLHRRRTSECGLVPWRDMLPHVGDAGPRGIARCAPCGFQSDVFGARAACLHIDDDLIQQPRPHLREFTPATRGHDEHVLLATILPDEAEVAAVLEKRSRSFTADGGGRGLHRHHAVWRTRVHGGLHVGYGGHLCGQVLRETSMLRTITQGSNVLGPRPPCPAIHDERVRDTAPYWRADAAERAAVCGQDEHVLLPGVLLDKAEVAVVLQHNACPLFNSRRIHLFSLKGKIGHLLELREAGFYKLWCLH
mmetsp:Transcript_75548/g.209930  ORF Transcript_75548/g.209930 Transcript_75548/m.209930 type:complete len:475 (+) Transcript_75548:119-1543(+)